MLTCISTQTGDAELADGNNGAASGCFPEAAVSCVCAADMGRLLLAFQTLLLLFDNWHSLQIAHVLGPANRFSTWLLIHACSEFQTSIILSFNSCILFRCRSECEGITWTWRWQLQHDRTPEACVILRQEQRWHSHSPWNFPRCDLITHMICWSSSVRLSFFFHLFLYLGRYTGFIAIGCEIAFSSAAASTIHTALAPFTNPVCTLALLYLSSCEQICYQNSQCFVFSAGCFSTCNSI